MLSNIGQLMMGISEFRSRVICYLVSLQNSNPFSVSSLGVTAWYVMLSDVSSFHNFPRTIAIGCGSSAITILI